MAHQISKLESGLNRLGSEWGGATAAGDITSSLFCVQRDFSSCGRHLWICRS